MEIQNIQSSQKEIPIGEEGKGKTGTGSIGAKLGGVLTDRDRLACQWVCEQGAMTADQLYRAVWWSPESRSGTYAYNRIGFLARAGFLRGARTSYSLKIYYKATKLAHDAASEIVSGDTIIPLHHPKESETLHTDGLTELRLAVLRAGRSTRWQADRALVLDARFPKERFYGHLPDAVWTMPSGRKVAVEYERTRKGTTRVRAKVEAFARELARPDRVFDRILWVGEGGALPTLRIILSSHPEQVLRTREEFLSEIARPIAPGGLL